MGFLFFICLNLMALAGLGIIVIACISGRKHCAVIGFVAYCILFPMAKKGLIPINREQCFYVFIFVGAGLFLVEYFVSAAKKKADMAERRKERAEWEAREARRREEQRRQEAIRQEELRRQEAIKAEEQRRQEAIRQEEMRKQEPLKKAVKEKVQNDPILSSMKHILELYPQLIRGDMIDINEFINPQGFKEITRKEITPKDRDIFNCLLEAANVGNPSSYYPLALCYATGTGTESDEKKAKKWAIRAAESGIEDSYEMAVNSLNISELLERHKNGERLKDMKPFEQCLLWAEKSWENYPRRESRSLIGRALISADIKLVYGNVKWSYKDAYTRALWMYREKYYVSIYFPDKHDLIESLNDKIYSFYNIAASRGIDTEVLKGDVMGQINKELKSPLFKETAINDWLAERYENLDKSRVTTSGIFYELNPDINYLPEDTAEKLLHSSSKVLLEFITINLIVKYHMVFKFNSEMFDEAFFLDTKLNVVFAMDFTVERILELI